MEEEKELEVKEVGEEAVEEERNWKGRENGR